MHLPLPRDKHDTENAQALIALSWEELRPAMPQILEWVQDVNWPVAGILLPYLAGIGPRLAPYVKTVLASNDEQWKYFVLQGIVRHSRELAFELDGELQRFAHAPTMGELEEGVAEVAREILQCQIITVVGQ
ncbi:DUF5071 domain-containing protein [Janthinobacterium lividum]|uniref:DUF5071 domain-containing protein n=1 Tax=Janthinobacterium lividum TaxID=29581 RepID=UPI0008744D9D|nr:DUF5071 domain-containing protein [Janthinobacterium lividum]MCC7712657.1 DUF5071 domain-containing protein [Janthinobacterium lividum]OEZ45624.1 hypothetical protein JANLI_58290 [Janthinobacterium lividum]WQE26672.1 DUF5071 domain-containing protein [Janthinobacterium lividum]STQ97560.1 Uncharacterised protein [Janthinobacterium lividum]